MEQETQNDRPTVQLCGRDGNAFAILGACHKAARSAGWTQERLDTFTAKATSGDYDHLLGTVMEYFDVH